MSPANTLTEVAPGFIHTPFTILVDKAEKHPWTFDNIVARSFIDKDQWTYMPRTDRRYLGIGMGDYSIDGFQDKIAIERKSMEDFQGTLLGWPHDLSDPAVCREWDSRKEIHRRGRFKNELRKLQSIEARAVIVEAPLGECLADMRQWGVRTAEENAKYLYATYLSWSQQFRVQWYFCDDRRMAEVTAFRIMEKFWDRHRKEYRQRMRDRSQLLLA